MALVFFTLGLVIVAMILLTKLPWLRAREAAQEPQDTQVEAAPSPAPPSVGNAPGTAAASSSLPSDELARVAAIAVAVLRSRRGTRLRAPQPTETRSAWKSYGRAHQLGL
jgi:hypothetical protein